MSRKASAPDPAGSVDLLALGRDARAAVAEALALTATCHLPGMRDRRRELLGRGIELAHAFVIAAEQDGTRPDLLAKVLWALAQAHSARAEDARYGAGQLAQGSQRAPTEDDCEDGWRRVESIVATSEESAQEVARIASKLNEPRAERLARGAEAAAVRARRTIAERNRSYTFHTDPSFSFGEGWYVAAAGVLAGVSIQLEPGGSQLRQAELFLRDAHLGSRLAPYRSRPRANKALPDVIARAFREDPRQAQERLRAAFLGNEPISPALRDWVAARFPQADARRKVLLWVRHGEHHPGRNTEHAELLMLARMLLENELTPVLIGDAVRGGDLHEEAVDLTLFWKEPLFQAESMRRAQLQLFEQLKLEHGLVGQLGVTTAGMDGPALMGLPTRYLTQDPNVRLGRWVGVVPEYEEIVRGAGFLERIAQTLQAWRRGTHPGTVSR